MTPLEEHEHRIALLERAVSNHEANIQLLRDILARTLVLQEVVVKLLQEQRGDDAANGR